MSRGPEVIDTDLGMKRIIVTMGEADGAFVTVGIHEGEIARYAAFQEFGTRHIRPRPFLRTAFDSNIPKYIEFMKRMFGALLDGKGTVKGQMVKVGFVARNDIIRTIQKSGLWHPLEKSTIRSRRSRARGSKVGTKPLVDTGAMLRAVGFKVTA